MPCELRNAARREFIKAGAILAGNAAIGGSGVLNQAFANNHPNVHEGSLGYLDRNTYIEGMQVHSVFEPKLLGNRGMHMMAQGDRRYFFTDRSVLEVTDPLNPMFVNEDAWESGAFAEPAIAYNQKSGRWLMIVGEYAGGTFASESQPAGKYHYPSKIAGPINYEGLRGCRIYDVSDPTNLTLLSEWSVDQRDPHREIQTGQGAIRIYYDGGKYAYLDAGPDNSFTHMESPYHHYTRCLQIIDVEDPSKPSFVSNWWVPGQREGEDEEYEQWSEHGDRTSWTSANTCFQVPRRVEDGGKYCYSCWGRFGFMIHDVSDPANPKLVGKFDGDKTQGEIDFFSCNLSWLDKGIVVTQSETLEPDCGTPMQLPWILDVSDPTNIVPLSQLPRPIPPVEAPYDDFCDKRGRFGTRSTPRLLAPGRVDKDLHLAAYFNAGLQCFDISDPGNPRIAAYFIPPQGGDLNIFASFNRTVQGAFIEWDRRLIWVGSDTGLYLLSSPLLGEPILAPMPVEEWTVNSVNEGYDG